MLYIHIMCNNVTFIRFSSRYVGRPTTALSVVQASIWCRAPVAIVIGFLVIIDFRHQQAPPSAEASATRPATLRQRHQVQPGQAADRSDQRANTIQTGHGRQAKYHQGAVHEVPGGSAGRRTAVRAHCGRP